MSIERQTFLNSAFAYLCIFAATWGPAVIAAEKWLGAPQFTMWLICAVCQSGGLRETEKYSMQEWGCLSAWLVSVAIWGTTGLAVRGPVSTALIWWLSGGMFLVGLIGFIRVLLVDPFASYRAR